jgi:sugar lactone lactonase YvrE
MRNPLLLVLLFASMSDGIFAQSGKYMYLTQWGNKGSGNGQFNSPHSITMDASGNFYVTDEGNYRVEKFNHSGGFIRRWGSEGDDVAGKFSNVTQIAVDRSGNVFTVDQTSINVQKFDSMGNFITKWGGFANLGTGNGQFTDPAGIAVDASGNVYVSDIANNNIQKFTNNGRYLKQWGSTGYYGQGQFNEPASLAVDAIGNVYVADFNGNYVQKFDSSGRFLKQWGSNTDPNFPHPYSLAVDDSANIFVTYLYAGDYVDKFDSSGVFKARIGTTGSGNGQLKSPYGMTVDKLGNLYVVDHGNNRVEVFAKQSIVTALENGFTVSKSITVYPNPSSRGLFYFKNILVGTPLSIENLAGRQVYASTYDSNSLDLSSQPKGIYILQIQATTGTQRIKLMVE